MNTLALADSCESCLTPEWSVPARPYLVQPDGEHGVRAYYRCSGCGHRWWTSWMPGSGHGLLRAAS